MINILYKVTYYMNLIKELFAHRVAKFAKFGLICARHHIVDSSRHFLL